MEDIKFSDFCDSVGAERAEIDKIRKKLGIKCRLESGDWVISLDEAEVLRKKLALAPEFHAETLMAKAVRRAPNPNWLYCSIEGEDLVQPVLIPRRFHGRLDGKRFPVERIVDKNGVTYRHEWFARLSSYNG